jgi:hypothetical protein
MSFDPRHLFETSRARLSYLNVGEELKAVANESKAISAFLFPDDVIAMDSFYLELKQQAEALGLSISTIASSSLSGRAETTMSYVFLYKNENERWRIPAYLSLKRAFEHYGWSDGAEYLEGSLLGYSDGECSRWLGLHHAARAGWTGKTIYFLFNSSQAVAIRTLGMRAIDPRAISHPIIAFFNRTRAPVRANALATIPNQLEVMRASVDEPFHRELFGDALASSADDVVLSSISTSLAERLNLALRSNFEVFTSGEWR